MRQIRFGSSVNHVTDRSLLRFPEEVKRQFAFLEALGFRCVRAEPTLVRYESPAIGINIHQGRKSYEIGLEIEPMQMPTKSYPFSAILRLVDAKRGESYRNYAAHTVEGVAAGWRQLGCESQPLATSDNAKPFAGYARERLRAVRPALLGDQGSLDERGKWYIRLTNEPEKLVYGSRWERVQPIF